MNEKLSLKTKFVFGFGDLGNSIASTIIMIFFLNFLTDTARISSGLAGVLLLIGKAWDAFIDPVIGQKSDRLESKMGRRRPFFLFSALPFAVFFVLLWNVPEFTNQAKAVYVFVCFIAFITFFSLIQIPYSSLTAQLTEDYDERTSLTSYRMAFSILAGLLSSVLPVRLIRAFAAPKTGYSVMGLVFGFVILFSPLALFFFIKEKKPAEQVEKYPFFKGIKEVFKNKPFIPAALMFLFTWMAIYVIAAMMIYYMKYWLHIEGKEDIILGLIFITAGLFLPFWYKVSVKLGKKRAYTFGCLLMMVVFSALYFVPAKDRVFIYILAFLGGVGISAAHLLPWSIIPDVVEYDELKTGKRREGIYYGFTSFLFQLSASGALFTAGIVLEIFGYVPDVEQTSSSLFAIRFLTGFVPAILVLIGIISLRFYPITAEVHEKIRRILQEKRLRYGR